MENTEKKGIFTRVYLWFKNLTLKGLLGAILVAFIIIIILMSVSYLPSALSRISNSLSAALYSIFVPTENATLTVDKKIINSGEDFTINFKKGDDIDGVFTVSYACISAVELFSVESSGLKKIQCETQYYLLENETSLTIKTITGDSLVRLVIDGSFENNATQKIEKVGVARITVKNNTLNPIVTIPVTEPVTTPTNTPTTPTPIYIPPTINQPVYYGKPDLAVRMLQTGTLNTATNIVTNKNIFTYQEMIGIKFEVRNDGDANTGSWNFTASLPSNSTPTYSSNTQVSLRPGESIIFTLGFSDLTNQYIGQININVDPQNVVKESTEYNNIVNSTIINASYNSNNYNNNNYNNGCYINGIFTYNCNNNWDYNYSDLQISCYARPNNPDVGDRVRWYVDVTGGDEDDYDYDWTGTNGLDSSSENPSKTYTSRGTKRATVTVESNGDEASATCSVYVD
jgi:hypothetical protein